MREFLVGWSSFKCTDTLECIRLIRHISKTASVYGQSVLDSRLLTTFVADFQALRYVKHWMYVTDAPVLRCAPHDAARE